MVERLGRVGALGAFQFVAQVPSEDPGNHGGFGDFSVR